MQRPPDRPGMSVREQLERKAPGGMGHHGLTDSDLRMQAEDALLFGGGGVGGGDGHWNATAIVDNRHQFLADQAFKALEKLSVEAASSKKLGEDVLREIKSAADDLPGEQRPWHWASAVSPVEADHLPREQSWHWASSVSPVEADHLPGEQPWHGVVRINTFRLQPVTLCVFPDVLRYPLPQFPPA